MIIGIGNDIVEIERIEKGIERSKRFLDKLLTPVERERVERGEVLSYESIAGIFAAKEAVSKALGTGFVTFELRDIEVLKDEKGKPFIKLYGGALALAEKMGMTGIHISISHCKAYATAFAVAERGRKDETCH